MEEYNIKIQFFEEDQLKNAIKGGVYLIDLLKDGKAKPIPLYVGESAAVIKRCGEHLYTLFNNSNYLGLKSEDLERSDLTLRFRLVKMIKDEKKFWWDQNYKDKELAAYENLNLLLS